jgi:hypothetical protein
MDANSWQSLVAFLAAETGHPLPLLSRPLQQTHGAWPKGSTLPCTMQNATLGARGASPREVAHAERRWRMHGGSKTRPPQRQRRRSWGGRHASCGWSKGGSQLLTAAPRRVATPPLPATDPEHSEPGGAGVRGKGALSGGSTRGARGGGGAERSGAKGCGFESFRALPKKTVFLNAANKRSEKKSAEKRRAAIVQFLVAPPWIAPQLRAQGHVEARRQKVVPLRGHAAKDRLAVCRDAAARRQWLAAVGVRAVEVLDLLWRRAIKRASLADRCLVTSPVPATDPEPGGAGVRGRGALSGGSTRGVRGARAEPSGAKGCGFESFGRATKQNQYYDPFLESSKQKK